MEMRKRISLLLAFAGMAFAQDLGQSSLPQAYLNAVADAQRIDARKISRDLIAITPYERGLIWQRQRDNGNSRVKVVTWIEAQSSNQNNAPSSNSYRIGPMTAPAGYDDATLIWVTAVPQLKAFCSEYRGSHRSATLPLRIEQVLGLPPAAANSSYVVEFWVRPDDLLRPAPDPEVTDHEAGLDFPESSRLVTIDPEYKEWFLRHKSTVYIKPVPGTWTRLGYTYDWGNPHNPVGLSEFIIRPQAHIEVSGIYSTDVYCS
jgi:hypothetical protein